MKKDFLVEEAMLQDLKSLELRLIELVQSKHKSESVNETKYWDIEISKIIEQIETIKKVLTFYI